MGIRWTEADLKRIQERRGLKAESVPSKRPALVSLFDSKLEEDFAKGGYLQVCDQRILEVQYHPVRFYLLGASYKIDFCLVTEDELLWVEVKGNKEMRNYRDARSKLRAVARMYRQVPFFRFFQVTREKGAWIVEEIRK